MPATARFVQKEAHTSVWGTGQCGIASAAARSAGRAEPLSCTDVLCPLLRTSGPQVLPTLQVAGQPHMFAVGDCNDVAETKKGYLAQQQAELAAASIKVRT